MICMVMGFSMDDMSSWMICLHVLTRVGYVYMMSFDRCILNYFGINHLLFFYNNSDTHAYSLFRGHWVRIFFQPFAFR